MPLSLRRRALSAVGALGALLLFAGAAQAATLSVETGGVYVYNAGSGIANLLNITVSDGSVNLSEQAEDPITVSGSLAGTCTGSGSKTVSCTTTASSFTANMGGEALTDTVDGYAISGTTYSPSLLTINGGPGNDRLNAAATLNGDAGNDELGGSNFPIVQNGGAGNDRLRDGDQAQTMNGGTGEDTADFSAAGNITVSIDGVANDGGGGVDNVGLDVENLRGGNGNDVLTGTSGTGNVANKLFGGIGNDVLNGLDGGDVLDGEGGADVLNGGTGIDTASYSERAEDVAVVINDNGNDGEAGENDFVKLDIENVVGGFGDDLLTGSSGDNALRGEVGNDSILGGGGNDNLNGGSGQDDIDGQFGNDTIEGSHGGDFIDGGPGNDIISGSGGFDHLEGGIGTDNLSGGEAADELFIRDGQADTANCGAGTDTVVRDATGDTVNADCEVSTTGAAASAVSQSEPAAAPAAVASVRVSVSCRLPRSGRQAITCRLSFVSGAPGAIRARLIRAGRVFAIGRAPISAGRATLRLQTVRNARRGAYALALRDASGRLLIRIRVSIR